MNIRDIIKEEPKQPELFIDPASPRDKEDFKIQKPEVDTDYSNPAYKKAQKDFGRTLQMLQSTYQMLKGFGQTDPAMEAKIKDLIQNGIKAGYLKGV